MSDPTPINWKCERAMSRLLAQHQAIIDAWYDRWLKDVQARADTPRIRVGTTHD